MDLGFGGMPGVEQSRVTDMFTEDVVA